MVRAGAEVSLWGSRATPRIMKPDKMIPMARPAGNGTPCVRVCASAAVTLVQLGRASRPAPSLRQNCSAMLHSAVDVDLSRRVASSSPQRISTASAPGRLDTTARRCYGTQRTSGSVALLPKAVASSMTGSAGATPSGPRNAGGGGNCVQLSTSDTVCVTASSGELGS